MWLLRRASTLLRVGRPDSRFTLGIAVPATIVLAVAAATLVFALNDIAGEVDRTALSFTRQSVRAAVTATVHRMGETHGDYAIWDDAARKLYGTIDQPFVDDSFVSSTQDPVFFDTAYLLEADGTTVFAYRNGASINQPAAEAFGPSLARLLRATEDATSPVARSALVRGIWGPMVVALGPVVPFSQDVPVPQHKRILVLARSLNSQTVQRLSQDYLIGGLALASPSAAEGSPTAFALTDPDGKTIAALTWKEVFPGSAALARLNPWVIGMLAALAATMLVLVAIATHGFAKLRRGEVLARHVATHDSLSGLPNRTALLAHLKGAIRKHHGDGELALVSMELDDLKEINDAYGHEVGDHVLRQAAKRFQSLAGECYLVRLGGDEFVVLIDKPNAFDRANELAERLVQVFAEPCDVGGRIISVGITVGIVPIDHAGISAEEALRRGDVALYQARQEGRNRIRAFDDSLDAARRKRLEIAGDLRRALAVEGLTLFYQPVFSASDGHVVSAEALVRWPRSGDSPPISPAEFIPIAEETGLIDELGMWTLRRACRDAAAWPGLKVSVNVSPAQLPNPKFAAAVAAVLKLTDFPADRLEIEVTETFLVTHPDQARRAIEAIRRLGVSVALDDFGVGYASIGYLRSFAFDKLKLDRSMIAGIDGDPCAQKLVQATVALADALELSVTAEGVETEEEAALLRIAGCDAFQGFYFARPAPAADLTALLGAEAQAQPSARSLLRA
jgi:diguanylate cyclase (GGDEF)-like protein